MGVRLFSYRPAGFIRLWNMICNHLPFDSGCLTTPQPTRSRLALSSDMRVLISNDTCESISYFLLSLILLTAGQDLHEECFGAWEHFNFHRVLSVVAIRIIGACLSTSSRRLLLRYWATPVGSSPVTSTSFTTVLSRGVQGNILHDGAIFAGG